MDRPNLPPDLYPIEHTWDFLNWQIRAREIAFDNFQELQEAIIEEWANIADVIIRNAIESMWRRVIVNIQANGGPTGYL